MIYLYWYLGVGAAVLAIVFGAHRLTKERESESIREILDAVNPERKKLSYRILNNFVGPVLAAVAIVVVWPVAIYMKGKEVFKLAVRAMDDVSRDILVAHNIAPSEVACIIPHQANRRIIEAIAQYLELPIERFFINLDRYGNTSAASIPLALAETADAGRFGTGDTVLLSGFGAGMSWASAVLTWGAS